MSVKPTGVAAWLAIVLVCLCVVACGRGDTERDAVAAARAQVEKREYRTAIVQIKAALQAHPSSAELRFLLGDALLVGGDPAAAALELEKARELQYDDDAVLPRLARAMLLSNQAKKVVDEFARTNPTDPRAAGDLKATVAAAYGALGMFDRAVGAMNAALQLDPKNTTARLLQAQHLISSGDIDKAIALVDAATADDPQRREAAFLKGEFLRWGKSDLQGAALAYRRAIAIDPRYTQARIALNAILLQRRDIAGLREHLVEVKKVMPSHGMTQYFETQLAFIDRDYKKAREGAQHLVKQSPENPRVLELAGLIEFEGGSQRLAEARLNKVLQIAPDLAPARRLLAQVYLRAGQPARAMTTIEALLRVPEPGSQTLAIAAEASLQSGDPGKAQTLFERAAKSNPSDAKVLTALALTQIARGESDIGFSQLERVASRDESNYSDLALISARLRRGDLDNALKAAGNLQTKAPDQTLPHHLYGQILASKGDRAGARKSFERALTNDPAYLPAISALAALDLGEKQPDAARKRFDAVLARDPNNYHVLIAIADIKHRSGGTAAEVRAPLLQAIRFNPAVAEPRLLLTEHYLAQGAFKDGLAIAQEAIAFAPDDRRVIEALGRAQLLAGEPQQAIASFKKLVGLSPDQAQPHVELAEAYLRVQDFDAATQALRKSLEINPNLVVAQKGLVKIALANDRVQEAVHIAKSIQIRRPADPIGYLLESDIHFARQRWPDTIAALQAALERKRSSDIAVRLHTTYLAAGDSAAAERFGTGWLRERPRDATFLFHLGSLAMDRREYAQAESRFRNVVAIVPGQGMALNNIAWLMLQQNKPGALAFAEQANQALPNRASVIDTLAAALAVESQFKSAVDWQRRAVELEPDVPLYKLGLARLLIKSGDRPSARVELQALQKLGSTFSERGEVDQLLKTL